MVFLLFIFCSVVPVIGHILVGVFSSWDIVGTILILQLFTFVPIIGPIIACFSHGIGWGVFLLFAQILIFGSRS